MSRHIDAISESAEYNDTAIDQVTAQQRGSLFAVLRGISCTHNSKPGCAGAGKCSAHKEAWRRIINFLEKGRVVGIKNGDDLRLMARQFSNLFFGACYSILSCLRMVKKMVNLSGQRFTDAGYLHQLVHPQMHYIPEPAGQVSGNRLDSCRADPWNKGHGKQQNPLIHG